MHLMDILSEQNVTKKKIMDLFGEDLKPASILKQGEDNEIFLSPFSSSIDNPIWIQDMFQLHLTIMSESNFNWVLENSVSLLIHSNISMIFLRSDTFKEDLNYWYATSFHM